MTNVKTLLFGVILSVLFRSAGGAEFHTFSTAGHPKAQGLSISIEYPASWVARDNPRPGVVHEFRDPATGGRDALMIVVPTSQPRNGTSKEFRRWFEQKEAQERTMPGARHRKKEFIDDLGYACVALDYDLDIPQLAPAVAQVRNYIILIGEQMVQVQFYGVAPPSDDIRTARERMMRHIVRSIKKA